MDWYKTLNQLNGVAQAQLQLAEIHRLQHEHTCTVQLYSLAYEQFNDTEDYRGRVACLHCIGIAQFQDDPYSEAWRQTESEVTATQWPFAFY